MYNPRIVSTKKDVVETVKGGPEPLENAINEILGSKHEDRFSNPFFESVQNTTLKFMIKFKCTSL